MSNKLTEAEVVAKLNDLSKARLNWENGSYKKSNDELYNLLDRCFALFEQMSGEAKLIKELNDLLTERSITWNENTSLATKIARFVFNGSNKRITGYARVLRIARSEKLDSESFAAFIKRNGGVEEVRKKPLAGSLTKAALAKQNIALAEKHFVTSDPLVQDITCSSAELHPNNEAPYHFAAALVRKNADGTLSIVYGNNKSSVVKVLLAEAGKAAGEKLKLKALDEAKAKDRKGRDALAREVSKRNQAA